MSRWSPSFNRHSILARVLVLQGAGWVVLSALVGGIAWAAATELRETAAGQQQRLAGVVAAELDRAVAADLARVQALSGSQALFAPGAGAPDRAGLPPTAHGAPARSAILQVLSRAPSIEAIELVGAAGEVLVQEPAGASHAPLQADRVALVLQTGRPESVARRGPPVGAVVYLPLRDRAGGLSVVAIVSLTGESRAITQVLSVAGARLVPAADRAPTAGATLSMVPWSVIVPPALPSGGWPIARVVQAGLPLTLVLGALFAWGTARSLRRPLLQLSAAAERMTSGDLTTPLPALADDEIGRLGRVLEHLRVALADSLATISRHAGDLELRVQDRTRELEEACRRLHDRDVWRAQVLRKVISAQEDERRRLARELHDDTCQALAALSVSAESVIADLGDGAGRRRLENVKRAVDRALADLHRVIYDLRPSVLDDLGLEAGIRWLADEHLRRTGVTVRCEVSGLERRLPADLEIALFRVAQEAIINIRRHAEAETVLIQVSLDGHLLMLEIEDDGRGFDPAGLGEGEEGGRGLGLLGMRERIELAGGSCAIASAPGRGTRVVATAPVPDAPSTAEQVA